MQIIGIDVLDPMRNFTADNKWELLGKHWYVNGSTLLLVRSSVWQMRVVRVCLCMICMVCTRRWGKPSYRMHPFALTVNYPHSTIWRFLSNLSHCQ
jgi:hypothetical protein